MEFLLGKRAKNPVSVQDIPEAPRATEERRNRGDCSGPRLRWEERGEQQQRGGGRGEGEAGAAASDLRSETDPPCSKCSSPP